LIKIEIVNSFNHKIYFLDDGVKKLKEIGNIAQIKLEDNGFGDILDLHSQVLNSGYPNYSQFLYISVLTILTVKIFFNIYRMQEF
jgi:hypothetical protein